MKRDVSTVVVPFPNKLMSSARSAMTMPAGFGREVRNMLMAADGAGAKRGGVAKVGGAIAGEVMVHVCGFMAAGGYQILVVTDAGKVYRKNGAGWDVILTGLDPSGTVRTVEFGNRLVMCNGVDTLRAYDGTAWTEVSQLVTDTASGLAYVNATTFSINSDAAFYAVGTVVRASLGASTVTASVASVSTVGSVVTVVLGSAVLTNALSAVAFTVKPPRFAQLAVAHDRLWGFGRGPLQATLRAEVDRMRIFYTDGVNDAFAWAAVNGVIPSLNLADKAGVADELLAMAVKDNLTVFFSRNHLQLWSGSDPDADGDFSWNKTIPLGLVHGSALVELPNDVLFVTRSGVRTLSRTVQTEQLDVSDVGAELDPTFSEVMALVSADAPAYRRLCTLRHDGQGWFGFAFSDRTLVWQVGAFGQGWVIFDGAFAGVSAAHSSPDGVLYLAKGGQLYAYDPVSWSDDGAAITTRWWLPWVNPAGNRRWANRYVEVLMDPGSEVPFSLKRYRDYDEGNPLITAMTSPVRPDFWDTADWNEALWDNGQTTLPVMRDHVVADSYGFCVESSSTAGPLVIFGLKLYGVAER